MDFHAGSPARALIEVCCSSGTYVRSLTEDIGRAAGCGAHLGFLLRTAAGRFRLTDAATVEEFAALGGDDADRMVLDVDYPLNHLSAVELDANAARAFAHGTRVSAGYAPAWPLRVYGPDASFLGLGEVLAKGTLCPRVVVTREYGGGKCV
jgi:tRNA pseudouridine55 synthase